MTVGKDTPTQIIRLRYRAIPSQTVALRLLRRNQVELGPQLRLEDQTMDLFALQGGPALKAALALRQGTAFALGSWQMVDNTLTTIVMRDRA